MSQVEALEEFELIKDIDECENIAPVGGQRNEDPLLRRIR
jgi:hypothetical protein